MLVAQRNRAVQSRMKAVARGTREVEQRIGQTEVRVVPDTAVCRRANGRVRSRLESVDGGSGGMSTRRAADGKRPEKSAGVRLSPLEAGPRDRVAAGSGSDPAGGLRSDPAEGREVEEARNTRRKVTWRAESAGDLASGVGLDAGGATVWGGATAVGASGADAAGGPRSRGGEGGEEVGGPPEAGVAEARGWDAQSLSRCRPLQCAQLRIMGPKSLARALARLGAVVEATGHCQLPARVPWSAAMARGPPG